LEEQKLGAFACKLPCGHIYHKTCLIEWLKKHATCPVCRFELETNDEAYEKQRKEHMKKRKLRFRKNELEKYTISQLREISTTLEVSITGCIDKREIIEKLLLSRKIELTECVPAIEMTREELFSKSVKDLRHLSLSFDISIENAIEKAEICAKLLESGRIVLINNTSPVEELPEATSKRPQATPHGVFHEDELRLLPISQLMALCAEHQVSVHGCIDREDIINAIKLSNNVDVIIPESKVASSSAESASSASSASSNSFMFGGNAKSRRQNDAKQETDDSNSMKYDYKLDDSKSSDYVSSQDAKAYSNHSSSSSAPSSPTNASEFAYSSEITDDPLLQMSIKELRSIAAGLGVDLAGCLEKSEMVSRLKKSGQI
jgi:hypothetical protein